MRRSARFCFRENMVHNLTLNTSKELSLLRRDVGIVRASSRLAMQMKVIENCKNKQDDDEPHPSGVRRRLKFSIPIGCPGGANSSIVHVENVFRIKWKCGD
jgi:hypothetical protein